MKKISAIVTLCAGLLICGAYQVFSKSSLSDFLFTTPGLCADTTAAFDVGDIQRFSVQVVYSSGTYGNILFTEGSKATANIIVGTDFALLANATAFATIKVADNTSGALTGSYIRVNGHSFNQGVEWAIGNTSTDTAANIAVAMNTYTGVIIATASYGASSDTVRSSATAYGSYANSLSIVSSTPTALVLSGAVYSGGRDGGTITINGTVLTASVDFAVGSSTAATATNIAAAINANSSLSPIVVATAPAACATFITGCGIVFSTAVVPGASSYSLSTSSRPILTPSGSIYTGGVAGALDSATNIITSTYTFPLGQGVFTGATVPTGLSAGTTYFVIPVAYGTTFKLATTLANAVAGTAIDISTTSAGGGSYTLQASTYTAGSAGFLWQSSNDGSTWSTLPAISSVTVPGSGTLAVSWDFGLYNYRYLRMNFTGPTRGCVVTNAYIQGKKDPL